MIKISQVKRLYITSFLQGLYFFFPIFTLYFIGHGVSLASIIIAQTCYSLFSFVGEIPTGIFADKLGQKNSVIIGNVVEILGIIGLVFFPTTLGLFISYSIRGFGGAFISGADESWTYEICKHDKEHYKKVAAHVQTIGLVGSALAAATTGVVIQLFGVVTYPWLIVATAVSVTLSLFVSMTLRNYPHETHEKKLPIWTGIVVPAWRIIRNNKIVRALIIVLVLSLNGEYFLTSIYQPIMIHRTVLPLWLGLGMAIGTVLNACMIQLWVRLHSRYTFSTIQTICTILIGCMFLLFALTSSPIISVISFILTFGLFETTRPLISEYIHKEIESHIRSTVVSAVSLVRTGAQIGMRLLIGAMIGIFSPIVALVFFGSYLLIGGFIGKKVLKDCGCTD